MGGVFRAERPLLRTAPRAAKARRKLWLFDRRLRVSARRPFLPSPPDHDPFSLAFSLLRERFSRRVIAACRRGGWRVAGALIRCAEFAAFTTTELEPRWTQSNSSGRPTPWHIAGPMTRAGISMGNWVSTT